MAEKFDEFSKHLAKKHTRRGLLRFFGAGIIGAFTASALPKGNAEADQGILHIFNKLLVFNGTNPQFNSTLPFLLSPPPTFNSTRPPIYFNKTLPWFLRWHK
jgi:hypothetical protein